MSCLMSCACLLILWVIVGAVVLARSPKRRDQDFVDAVDALVGVGLEEQDAYAKVQHVRRRSPNADFHEMVREALVFDEIDYQ